MSSPPRHRLWVEHITPGCLIVTDDRARYLRNVLRLSRGGMVRLMAGDGYTATAEITNMQPESVELAVGVITTAPRASLELTVALPTPKGERADWLVEKLTELGVARIAWIMTARTVVVTRAGGQRSERWQRLAEAAAKQCGRAQVPQLLGPLAQDEILHYQATTRYIGVPGGPPLVRQLAVAPSADTAILLLGPEGGFTDDEAVRAQQSGYLPVGLGLHTLRMETAAIAGAAMLLCDVQGGSTTVCDQSEA